MGTKGQEFDKELEVEQFTERVMQLRSCNTATVRDVNILRQFILEQNTERNLHLTRLEQICRNDTAKSVRIEEALASLTREMRHLAEKACSERKGWETH